MEIKYLKILSKNIDSQRTFYSDVLGFLEEQTPKGFRIITQENSLYFEKSEQDSYYHFAFLIPTGSIHQAIHFLESLDIELLLYKKEKIIQFDQGKAIYFYDKDGNIIEFIERPLLSYPHSNYFSINSVIKINEIGLPHNDPMSLANVLINDFGITPIDQKSFRNDFCWVGDHNGVIILTKEGRNWLPTNKPGVKNDFSIGYENKGKNYLLSIKNSEIVNL